MRVELIVVSLSLVVVTACDGRSEDQARSRTTATTSSSTSASMPAPAAAVIDKPCLRPAEQDKAFRFRTSDGATLVGVVLGTGHTGLVLGHQLGSDLCEWLPQARAFAKVGYRVLAAATRIRPPVAGVVSLSGPSGFGGVDAQGAMARLEVPVLFVVAADDQHFTEQARVMYRAARVRDKRLLVVPGGGHGTSMVEFGEDAPRVLATLRRFIADHTRP
jgi:pimeloyl-ACP methyl ester carboxylesterase